MIVFWDNARFSLVKYADISEVSSYLMHTPFRDLVMLSSSDCHCTFLVTFVILVVTTETELGVFNVVYFFSFPFTFVPLQRRGCLVAPLFI
jgi:hypothetical protein